MPTTRRFHPAAAAALSAVVALASRGALAQQSLDPANGGSQPRLEADTRLPMGPILLGGFSLVLVATGAGFGWQASQERDDWKTAQSDPAYAADPAAGQDRVDELADDVQTHSVTANVLMFSGAALAAVSIIWLLIGGGREDDEGAETAWRAGFGPGSASLQLDF